MYLVFLELFILGNIKTNIHYICNKGTDVMSNNNNQKLRFRHQRLETLARKTCEIYSFLPEISYLISSQCPYSFIMSCNICYSL